MDYTYDYSTTATSTADAGAVAAIMAFMAAYFFVVTIIAVIAIVAQWKIFTKAGKPGWAAIIPIYNIIVLLEIVGRPTWWVILFFLPVAQIVAMILVMLDLAKAFGKSSTFAIFGLIIFSLVGMLMLGFGDAKYVGAPNKTA